MAVTQQKSTQVSNTDAFPAVMNPTHDWHGRMRIARFEYTQSGQGDAGSLAELVKLPAGRVRLILPLSRIAFAAMGASRTMDLGWLTHTDDDGNPVLADPNGLDDGVDVSSAGAVNPGGTVGGDETHLLSSQSGVTLTAQINDGTFDDTKTLKGYFVYVVD